MKLPELPKRKAKAASTARGSSIKAPEAVQDLFKDMRDRRLIIPAIALLIAIIAVPVVLSAPTEPVVSAPAPAADPDAVAVEPAVLAVQEVGVRDFQKRLAQLKRKNPFGDRFEPDSPAGAGASVGALEDPVDTGDSGTSTVDTGGEPTGTSFPSSDPPAPPAPTGPPQEPFVLVPRVDVQVGIVDRDRRQVIEGVRAGRCCPRKRRQQRCSWVTATTPRAPSSSSRGMSPL